MSIPMTPEAQAKAEAALHAFVVEDWTLFSICLTLTIFRTYGRTRNAGWGGLQGDDYFIFVALVFYAAETTLAYLVGAVAMGLANNGMTKEQRETIDPNGEEYRLRVFGSMIQLAGWTTYSVLIWSLKASLLVLYTRLTSRLGKNYQYYIYFGIFFIAATWITAILVVLAGCRPLHKYWQISPDPGVNCQIASSPTIIWVYNSLNVATDAYLITVPMPLLWQSRMKLKRKAGLVLLFSGGAGVIAFSTVRTTIIARDPVNGASLSGSWAVRETFLAFFTTNAPVTLPLAKSMLTSAWGTMKGKSVGSATNSNPGSKTFGGGNNQSWRGRGPPTPNPITKFTFSESEERILNGGDVRLGELPARAPTHNNDDAVLPLPPV